MISPVKQVSQPTVRKTVITNNKFQNIPLTSNSKVLQIDETNSKKPYNDLAL